MKETITATWHDVNEKLPEDYGFYLATIVTPKGNSWVETVGYSPGEWQLPGRGKTNFVTHWMEIPKPAGKPKYANIGNLYADAFGR